MENEIFSYSRSGAFQHIKIFKKIPTAKETERRKKRFTQMIHDYLSDLRKDLSSEDYLEKISGFRDFLNRCGTECDVIEKDISFGVAQKLLNLYLKYEWCLGKIDEPPHCPVDSVILQELGMNELKWSQMDRGQYEDVIEVIKKKANSVSIAVWELAIWKKDTREDVDKSVAHHPMDNI